MTLSVESKDFQDTASNLGTFLERPEFQNISQEEQKQIADKFIEQSGLNSEEFYAAYRDYEKQVNEGRTDFRPQIELGDNVVADTAEAALGFLGRTVGRAIGDTAEGIEKLGEITLGKEAVDSIQNTLGEYIPDSIKKEAAAWLDPYHGDGISGGSEEIAGMVGSFLVPMGAFSKAGKAATFLTGKAGKGGAATEKFIQKSLTKKPVKLGALGVNAAASDALLTNDHYQAVEDIMENEDAAEALRKLEENPDDTMVSNYLSNFLESLGYEAAFLLAGGGLYSAAKAFNKTSAGKKATQLGKKYIGRAFSSRQGTDDNMLAMTVERNSAAQKALTEADGLASDLDRVLKKNDLKRFKSKEARQDFLENTVDKALKGDKAAINSLSSDASEIVIKMRNKIDSLSSYVADNVFKGKLEATIRAGMGEPGEFGTYINRSYRFFDDPKFASNVQNAVRQYSKNLNRNDITDENLRGIVDDAAQFIKRDLKLTNDTEVLDNLNRLVRETNDNGNAFFDITTSNSLLGSSKAAKKRSDVPKELRALWGEIKDPSSNYMKTYSKLATMKAEHKFLTDVATHLEKQGLAQQGYRVGEGQAEESLGEIAKQRASVIFNKDAAEEFLEANPALKDLYISDEYATMIKTMLDDPNRNSIIEMWGKAKGVSQAAKTIYNPATHGANTVGNIVLMAANGMIPFAGKGFADAFKATKSRISGKTNEELGQYVGKLIGYGLADSNVTLGLVRKNLNRLGTDKGFISGLADKKVAKLYEGEDFIFKAAHFEKTLDYLKKAKPKPRDLDEGEWLLGLEREAAQRTRDLMPNYSLVPKFFKGLRYSPIGDFVAFPAEMARISKNLVKYTMSDLTSGNDTLRRQAYKRLGGMTAVGMMPSIIEDMSAKQHGITPEEQEALDKIDYPYMTYTNKLYTSGIKQDGRGSKYVDRISFGNLDPFDSIKTAAKGLHELLLSEKDYNSTDATKIALTVLDKTAGPIVGPSMLTEALMKATTDTPSWRTYNDSTALGAATKAVGRMLDLDTPFAQASQVLSAFEPGFVSFAKRRYDYEKAKAAEYGYDNISEAIGKEPMGSEISNYYSPITANLIPDLMGFRKTRLDITGSTRRNLNDALKDINNAGKSFDYAVSQPNLLTGDLDGFITNISEEYRNAQRRNRSSQLALKGMLEYYNTLGLDLDDFNIGLTKFGQYDSRELKDRDLEAIANARMNYFSPFKISDSTVRRVFENTRGRFDLNSFFDLQAQLEGSDLE